MARQVNFNSADLNNMSVSLRRIPDPQGNGPARSEVSASFTLNSVEQPNVPGLPFSLNSLNDFPESVRQRVQTLADEIIETAVKAALMAENIDYTGNRVRERARGNPSAAKKTDDKD